MLNNYKEKFKVGTDGMHKLFYEDSSCIIELPADDVREPGIWICIGNITNKYGSQDIKLTDKQKLLVYSRVSAALRLEGHCGVYTDEFKNIEVNMEDIDISKNILDIE